MLRLTDAMIESVARRFRVLGEPMRLRILQALTDGEKTVGEIVGALRANQSNVSKHLQALHDAGLVARRPEGTSVRYSVADPVVLRLCDQVCRSTTNDARRQLARLLESSPGRGAARVSAAARRQAVRSIAGGRVARVVALALVLGAWPGVKPCAVARAAGGSDRSGAFQGQEQGENLQPAPARGCLRARTSRPATQAARPATGTPAPAASPAPPPLAADVAQTQAAILAARSVGWSARARSAPSVLRI